MISSVSLPLPLAADEPGGAAEAVGIAVDGGAAGAGEPPGVGLMVAVDGVGCAGPDLLSPAPAPAPATG